MGIGGSQSSALAREGVVVSYLAKVASLNLPEPFRALAAARARRCDAAAVLDSYLDKVAAALPPPARYAVRALQARVAAGDSLVRAVKVAYALDDAAAVSRARLISNKAAEFKRAQEDSDSAASREAASGFPTSLPTYTPSSFHGPVANAASFLSQGR